MIIATDFIAVTTTRDAINIQWKNRDTTHSLEKTAHSRIAKAQAVYTQRNHERKKSLFEKSSDCTNNK